MLQLTRCHGGGTAAGPVKDRCLGGLDALLDAVEAIQSREHGVHGSLKHLAGAGATDSASRSRQWWGRGEVRVVVQLALQHDGGLMGHGLGRGSRCHDSGTVAVQSGRLRVAGSVGSRVDRSRGQCRDHRVHGHLLHGLLLREMLPHLALGLGVVEVEGSLANGLGHHSSIHFYC